MRRWAGTGRLPFSSRMGVRMVQAAVAPLADWENFYVIIGSSAGALTGLTFVAITLVAGRRTEGASLAVAAFTTPTVVYFGSVLLVSAIVSAPWPALTHLAVLLGLCGLGGLGYGAIVVRRVRRETAYQLVFEDWLWYVAFPFVPYTALVVTAIMLPGNPEPALFVIGGAMVLLLFIGIRNAWDGVTYIAVEIAESASQEEESIEERKE